MPEALRREDAATREPPVRATEAGAGPATLALSLLGDRASLANALAGGSQGWRAGVVAGLQRTAGNQAVCRLLARDSAVVDEPAPAAAEPEADTGIGAAAATGRLTGAAKQLLADWGTLGTAEARAKRLAEAAIAELKAVGVPKYEIFTADLPTSNGQFDFTTWSMKLSKTVFDASTPSAAHIAGAVGTITHESRHAEQWFRMARLEAHHGRKADEIARRMRIPITVAQAAKNNPLRPDTAEGREAEAWYESVYGIQGGRAHQDPQRSARHQAGVAEREGGERAGEGVRHGVGGREGIGAAQGDRDARDVPGRVEKYRALPEEADAAKVGDAVESAVKAP